VYTQNAIDIKHRGNQAMKSTTGRKKYIPLVLVGGTIPTLLILSSYFELSKAVVIPLVLVLSLIFGSMALWAYANTRASRSTWWQDDSASGWRGY
jgi:hypothetical protein